MNQTDNNMPERNEVEDLLPWHAVGTLSRREADQVEAALAKDDELARRYALVREELGETIHLNETLGAPSSRALSRLMAAIEADPSTARRTRASFDVSGRLVEFFSQFSSRTLAWSAAAAVLAIVLQAGVLAGIYVKERGARYETASAPQVARVAPGAYALISFQANASAADITKFLAANDATIVNGPVAGGLYRVRVSAAPLSKDELGKVVARLAQQTAVVSTALPTE